MSLRFPRVLPSYAYRDPAEFVNFGVSNVAAHAIEPALLLGVERGDIDRDRYYRQARRLHVKQLMRGKR